MWLLMVLAACGPDPGDDTAPAPGLEVVARVAGLSTPESVRCDGDVTCYVSNVSGDPSAEDGDGFLSRITTDGEPLERRWAPDLVSGPLSLDAPKGMDIADGVLYVADITRVCAVSLADATAGTPLAVDGAVFLNDVAASPDGTLFFTDTSTGRIYRRDGSRDPAPITEEGVLDQPNGIVVVDDDLWVVSFGSPALYDLSADGRLLATFDMPAAGLDGLIVDRDGRFLVSSWDASGVYEGRPGGDWTLVAGDLPGPADLGYDGATHRLFVPLFDEGEVVVLQL